MSNTSREAGTPTFIKNLLHPSAYDHPAEVIRLHETHISWVIRAGAFAYKIKKPVRFGFLDFSTPDLRRFYCQEELRLNRRYAPEVYLGTLAVTGTPERPRMGGPGAVLDYAVQMRAFEERNVFGRLWEERRLLPEHLDAAAAAVARFHAAARRATPDDPHGQPARQRDWDDLNFRTLRQFLTAPAEAADLDALHTWTAREFERQEPLLLARKRQGFVRECHGDLHLGNIVLIDGCPTLFDGIEFNVDLRWIDVMSDVAFLAMDLESRGAPALAYRFLNRYLEFTCDYGGLALLDYYQLYRAMVRAEVACLAGSTGDPQPRSDSAESVRRYLDFGLKLIRPGQPRLIVTHGLSGAGKSHLAARLAERLPAFHLRSDIERRRLAETAGSRPKSRYSPEMTAAVYGHLLATAATLLAAGHSVIVDATFLRRSHRIEQERLARRSGAEFLILDCRAPLDCLRERIRTRALAGNDPSEADGSVLERQRQQGEPLDGDERNSALTVHTDTGQVDESGPGTPLAEAVAGILQTTE